MGADLEEANFEDADLQAVDLQEANLTGSNLKNTNLKGAKLKGAELQGTDLRSANLQNAELQGANLQAASLQAAELQGANLHEANLEGAELNGVNLEDANLQGANLEDASLLEADLHEANFQYANLHRAMLEQANLVGAYLEGASLVGANLIGADLEDADLTGANLQNAELQDAELQEATLQGASLIEAQLQGANLIGANLIGADFQGADLHDTDLSLAKIRADQLSATQLTQAIGIKHIIEELANKSDCLEVKFSDNADDENFYFLLSKTFRHFGLIEGKDYVESSNSNTVSVKFLSHETASKVMIVALRLAAAHFNARPNSIDSVAVRTEDEEFVISGAEKNEFLRRMDQQDEMMKLLAVQQMQMERHLTDQSKPHDVELPTWQQNLVAAVKDFAKGGETLERFLKNRRKKKTLPPPISEGEQEALRQVGEQGKALFERLDSPFGAALPGTQQVDKQIPHILDEDEG